MSQDTATSEEILKNSCIYKKDRNLQEFKYTSKKNKTLATNLFQSVGKVVWIKNETDLDKVTAVSGSGPAYYFLFI